MKAFFRQTLVKAIHINRIHTPRRGPPLRHHRRISAQSPAGMQRPGRRTMHAAGPRVQAKRAPPVILHTLHRDLHINRRALIQRQRGMQNQLINHRTLGILASLQQQLDVTRPRKHSSVINPMTSQPTMRGSRQPPRQHNLVLISQIRHRTQQRMIRLLQPRSTDIHSPRPRQPEGTVLEGVGGQLHGAGIGIQACPGWAVAMTVQPRHSGS
ncbi:hypothetical protein MSIMFB_03625 [Mycobacterium simulans]|uniref:Uncharacterized protein n=1 Tax=Mycobacterium simulans TaxID=627089 RepID=A0A7Z7INZ3_9MYCO|nr:hypothetical protein MSIMFB_03625 [Mycobacterium simulans]